MRFAVLCMLAVVVSGAPRPERVWADEQTNTLGGPSPDGRFITFVDPKTGNLAIRETGTVRILTNAAAGQFAYFSTVSPDSKRIAYAWFNDDKFYELRVVDASGSNGALLYRNEEAGFVQPCAWSPDGQFILTLLFRKDNISQIALVPAAGGAPRVLKSLNWVYPKRMDFAPDGKRIVYDTFARGGSQQRDIYVLAVDGSKESVLVEHPADDLFPVWGRDGKSIYFASDRGGSMGLWRVAAGGGQPVLVQRDIGRFLPMGLTSDGMFYFGLRHGDTDVFIAHIGKGGPARIQTGFPGRNASPEWSADGKFLAYLSRRGTENYGQDSRAIVVRNIETGEERDVRAPLAHIERVRWSEDGRKLLASGSDGKGRTGIFSVDVGSGTVTPVATGSDATFRGYDGDWGPDGKVVYARGQSLWMDRRELLKVDCEPSLVAAQAQQIAFACGSAVYIMTGSDVVRIAQISDKNRITAVRWTSVGDLLFAVGAAVFRASPDEKASLVTTFKDSHGDIAVHPDGKTIAFTSGNTRSEVWTLRVAP